MTHSVQIISKLYSLWKSSTSGTVTSSLDMVVFLESRKFLLLWLWNCPRVISCQSSGGKVTHSPCGCSGGQHVIFLKTISILFPFIFPRCDWTPPISATRGAGWDIAQLQGQELLVSLYSVLSHLGFVQWWNSWSGKQLEGGKDRWRKSGTRAQEARRWQVWSGLAQEAQWRELEQSWLQIQRNRAILLPCNVAIRTSKLEISSGISCLIATHRPILHF